jgi:hypothetical protein
MQTLHGADSRALSDVQTPTELTMQLNISSVTVKVSQQVIYCRTLPVGIPNLTDPPCTAASLWSLDMAGDEISRILTNVPVVMNQQNSGFD